ncbi:MAG TPA: phosphatidylserine decarboxylase [Bryobacteraceae bacterium]|nr:phosphatidylserine decarboxylase [Bryobacteraceae bacterium]
MVKYGYYYAGALLAGALATAYLAGWPYSIPFYIFAAFCLNFFRDPERRAPEGPVAVSPADGKVVSVKAGSQGPAQISIFMNVFDVHVNRAPISGKIACVQYKKGDFLAADKEEASDANEQNIIAIDGVAGGRPATVVVKQIAGLIARRIICYKRAGDAVGRGERIGLIKFGSRVDVLFGPEWEITVRAGQRVSAGESVVARVVEFRGQTREDAA